MTFLIRNTVADLISKSFIFLPKHSLNSCPNKVLYNSSPFQYCEVKSTRSYYGNLQQHEPGHLKENIAQKLLPQDKQTIRNIIFEYLLLYFSFIPLYLNFHGLHIASRTHLEVLAWPVVSRLQGPSSITKQDTVWKNEIEINVLSKHTEE